MFSISVSHAIFKHTLNFFLKFTFNCVLCVLSGNPKPGRREKHSRQPPNTTSQRGGSTILGDTTQTALARVSTLSSLPSPRDSIMGTFDLASRQHSAQKALLLLSTLPLLAS